MALMHNNKAIKAKKSRTSTKAGQSRRLIRDRTFWGDKWRCVKTQKNSNEPIGSAKALNHIKKEYEPLWAKGLQTIQISALNTRGGNVHTKKLWAHTRPSLSIKSSFKVQAHNFCEVLINVSIIQVKKTSKGEGFSPCQAPIKTNILNTQIKACTCSIGYYSFKPTKEAISNNKKSLSCQITLQWQCHENKSLKMGQRLQLPSKQDHEK